MDVSGMQLHTRMYTLFSINVSILFSEEKGHERHSIHMTSNTLWGRDSMVHPSSPLQVLQRGKERRREGGSEGEREGFRGSGEGVSEGGRE